ncbi:MAG: hypothetical protein Q7N50_11760 [Armatimonadota bacterium]|nr:hypothetical protein [Armatimonadota bacterium]
MVRNRPVIGLAIFALALGILSGIAYAADPPKPAGELKLGVVDLGRVRAEYKEFENSDNIIGGMDHSLAAEINLRTRHKLLAAQEIEELVKLTALTNPTDKDQQRAEEITKKSNESASQLETLRAKKDPTEAEKAALTDLTQRETSASSQIATLRSEYVTAVEKKRSELQKDNEDKVMAGINALAQEKGLTTVMAKDMLVNGQVYQSIVLFGGTDITEDLLKKLNSEKEAKK